VPAMASTSNGRGATTWWTYPFRVAIWSSTSGEPTSCGPSRVRYEIPLAHIAEIRADPAIAHGWWHGIRPEGLGFTIARKTLEAVQLVLPSQSAIRHSLNVTGLAVPPSRDPHNLIQRFRDSIYEGTEERYKHGSSHGSEMGSLIARIGGQHTVLSCEPVESLSPTRARRLT